MKHSEFINKWLGKRYRESVALGYQCVGLTKLYCKEVYGIKNLSFGGSAINGFNGKGNLYTYFEKVDIPQQGDVVFFKPTPNNPYGHVGLFDTQKTVLEQNAGNGNGDGLGSNAIRLGKMPSNIAGYLRPKNMIEIKHLRQFDHKDCSLASVCNCYKLNLGIDSQKITQEVLNQYMGEYINKHPRDAFHFLKDKGYDIKLIPLTFEKAKIRMNKGSAVVLFLKGATPSESHWTCMKKENKHYLYDSTQPNKLEIDFESVQGVFGDSAFQIK